MCRGDRDGNAAHGARTCGRCAVRLLYVNCARCAVRWAPAGAVRSQDVIWVTLSSGVGWSRMEGVLPSVELIAQIEAQIGTIRWDGNRDD